MKKLTLLDLHEEVKPLSEYSSYEVSREAEALVLYLIQEFKLTDKEVTFKVWENSWWCYSVHIGNSLRVSRVRHEKLEFPEYTTEYTNSLEETSGTPSRFHLSEKFRDPVEAVTKQFQKVEEVVSEDLKIFRLSKAYLENSGDRFLFHKISKKSVFERYSSWVEADSYEEAHQRVMLGEVDWQHEKTLLVRGGTEEFFELYYGKKLLSTINK